MREDSNETEVNKPTVKIHDSSASGAADPYPGSDHVGGRDEEEGRSGGGIFAAQLACWEEFSLDGTTWPGFFFPALVGITRCGNSIKQ